MFTFLYVKVSSTEIGGEILFPFFFFFFRKMLMSAFLLRFKANYLEKMWGYTHFSLWNESMNFNFWEDQNRLGEILSLFLLMTT